MGKLIEEKEYVVEKDFEALVEVSAKEFNTRQTTPKVTSREFKVERDCTAIRNGMTVPLTKDQDITDVSLAFESVRQGAAIAIRERQQYAEGQVIFDEALGEALIAQNQPVRKQPKGTAEKAEAAEAKAAEAAAKKAEEKAAKEAAKAAEAAKK